MGEDNDQRFCREITDGERLADAHWDWTDALLRNVQPVFTTDKYDAPLQGLLKFIYISAFEHGYKHGKEN